MDTEKSKQEEARFEKDMAQARPLFSYKDASEVRDGKYDIVGRRIKKRAVIILIVSVICAIIFLLNGFFNLFTYFEQSRIFDLILSILWIFVGLLSAYQGLTFSGRLKSISETLLSRTNEQEAV